MMATRLIVRWSTPLCLCAAVLLAGCGARSAAPSSEPEPEDEVDIGYGTVPAGRVTGAVSSVHGRDLRKQPATRVEEMLRGRVPGVQVTPTGDGGYLVRIRGAGDFGGGGEPLFVVDGTPVHSMRPGSALEGIVPSDVVRIDVLRDAASAASYGVRGMNGVILITTRRPG
jgi:TonB-dependent SusC/RagA subfamily outer membrane receptor